MKLKPLEFVGVLALIGFFVSRQTARITEKILIGTIGAKIKGFSPQGVTIALRIPITNNSSVSMPIDSFQGSLMYGQYNLSQLFLSSPFTIEAGKTNVLPIDAVIDYSNTVSNVSSMVANGTWWQSFRVVGTVKSKGLSFSLNQPIQII